MKKNGKPKTHLWKLFLFLFSLYALAGILFDAHQSGKALNTGPLVLFVLLAAGLGLWWWKTRPIDAVLLARSPEKKREKLAKVSDQRQLLEIAEKSGGPIREEALQRITEATVFTEAAKELDTFALGQIVDEETLAAAAADPDFFRPQKRRESAGDYATRCLALRQQAVDQISDKALLYRLAHGLTEIAVYAGEKVLRDFPEEAKSICQDRQMPKSVCAEALALVTEEVRQQIAARPETARALAADGSLPSQARTTALELLVQQTEARIAAQPEAAKQLASDRSLPEEARLAAASRIRLSEELFSLYDPQDAKAVRRKLIESIQDQTLLAQIAELEPERDLRLRAELRVTDPDKRRAYCQRDGAHDWVETDRHWELYGETHHEVITSRCRYCGRKLVTEGDSFKD